MEGCLGGGCHKKLHARCGFRQGLHLTTDVVALSFPFQEIDSTVPAMDRHCCTCVQMCVCVRANALSSAGGSHPPSVFLMSP